MKRVRDKRFLEPLLQARRYVTQERLKQMLDTEYDIVEKNLRSQRGCTAMSLTFSVVLVLCILQHDQHGPEFPQWGRAVRTFSRHNVVELSSPPEVRMHVSSPLPTHWRPGPTTRIVNAKAWDQLGQMAIAAAIAAIGQAGWALRTRRTPRKKGVLCNLTLELR